MKITLKTLISFYLVTLAFSIPMTVHSMEHDNKYGEEAPPPYAPNYDRVDHNNVKTIIEGHLKRYPGVLNSSQGKDIVVFLGNTGAGKSTIINYLIGQNLKVNEDNEIVLAYPDDPSAMAIGVGRYAQTFLPRSVQLGDLFYYDLPGFGDNRGTATSLVNACFIKSIIEKAKSVKLVFVAGIGEITERKGRSFLEFMDKITQLIPGKSIEKFSSLIITKTDPQQGDLNGYLARKVDITPILQSWISNKMIGQLSKPMNSIIRVDEKAKILSLIERTGNEKVENINIDVIYDAHEKIKIKEIYDAEIRDIIERLILQNFQIQSLSYMNKENLISKKTYMTDSFKQVVYSSIVRASLIALLRPISGNLFQSSWQENEKELNNRIRIIVSDINEKINEILIKEQNKRDADDAIRKADDKLREEQENIRNFGNCSNESNGVHVISKSWIDGTRWENFQNVGGYWYLKCDSCGYVGSRSDYLQGEILKSRDTCTLQ